VSEQRENTRFEIDIREVPEEHVLLIREHVPLGEMSTVIPKNIEEVHGYLEELGLGFEGPPFCVCPAPDESGAVDAEIGWPVAEATDGRGRIEAASFPATRALVLKHVGPYDALPGSYQLLSEVIDDSRLTPTGSPREVYLTSPAEVADADDYETLIVWPIGPDGQLAPDDTFSRRVEA
jgi:effector-binding domain-containing protein